MSLKLNYLENNINKLILISLSSTHRKIFVLFCLLAMTLIKAQNNTPYNIVFIAVDDLKPTIRSYGDALAITPNLDFLARKSTLFLNNHTQQAICSPSRISLLTGKRPDYTKVYDLKTKMRDKKPNIITLPQHFKDMGFTTAGVGKIFDPRGVDRKSDAPSWSIPFVKPHQLSYPKSFGPPKLGDYQNEEIKANINAFIKKNGLSRNGNLSEALKNKYKPPVSFSDKPDQAYADGIIAAKAVDMIDDLSKDSKSPFFLAVGFRKPHLPFSAPKQYWDLYKRERMPLAEYRERAKNTGRLSYHNSGEMRSFTAPDWDYKSDKNRQLQMDDDLERELIHGYYACVTFIDFQIGKIVKKLKAEGLMDKTIIVVWGDHGYHFGDHRLWNKHSNFEQATRSPLIIYAPQDQRPRKVYSPTEFVDVFPTLCELANIPLLSGLDGRSLLPLMDGSVQSVKEYAVSQYPRNQNMGYSFRSSDYRYTLWINKSKIGKDISEKDIIQEELFDYSKDPLETENMIQVSGYEDIYKKIKADGLAFLSPQKKTPINKPKSKFGIGIQELLDQNNYDDTNVVIGATLNHSQLNSKVSDLFLGEFTYSTPENCAKQVRVHPSPGVWDWTLIDDYLNFADKYQIKLRIHGPISPQASRWAKADNRTPKELEKNMTEYFIALCKKMNQEPSVKWMDVVNETITREGNWFKEKPGTDQWENPWVQIGRDENGYPLYIIKAFEIANKYAPNISLVFNQHGGMEPKMWRQVKKTILYLRSKGLKINGLGWQAHLRSNQPLANDSSQLKFLGNLIDWAHENDLDFHVTEIDYKIEDENKSNEALEKQAHAYANILAVLISKKDQGVVTFNTWGMIDGKPGIHHDKSRFIFDAKLNPKPAYYAIKKTILNSTLN